MKMNLTPMEIYDKEFSQVKDKGYNIQEINDYLDLIIEDYMKFEKIQRKLKELEIENENLKIKINALKSNNKPDISANINSNVDVLQRISRLEQAVFGKNQ